jgi:Ni,Fe-hydrogenase III large subunit
MVTADEQRALERENAEADARVWDNLQDMNAAMAEDLKGVATATSERIAAAETAAADAAANAAERKARIEMPDRARVASASR